jgi:hypothetical protein
MPAMFWSLALLLLPEHAKARARVRQELQDTANSKRQQQQQQQVPVRQGLSAAVDGATMSAMLQLAMDRRSWVSRCVAEAIRLRLHSIAGGLVGRTIEYPTRCSWTLPAAHASVQRGFKTESRQPASCGPLRSTHCSCCSGLSTAAATACFVDKPCACQERVCVHARY